MAIREDDQALLDVFCHCYRLLLEHLDYLDGAVSTHRGWNGYRLVRECVDTTANYLSSDSLKTTKRRELCVEFLQRIEGAIQQRLSVDSFALGPFSDYTSAVDNAQEIACVDLTEWQRVGEELSRGCYCSHLPVDAPALCLSVEPVELVLPINGLELQAYPEKAQGCGKITCNFAARRFTFADYVNLPFYFFHEYLSHLHTAPMFAEHHESQDRFTDGWLVYYARMAYHHTLFHNPPSSLDHPVHRDHFMAQYLKNALDDVSKPIIYGGYESARQFAALAGVTRFERATLLIASTPYDFFDHIPDLHGEFVRRVPHWLNRVATITPWEQEGLLAQLDEVLNGSTPVRGLMEWLIY